MALPRAIPDNSDRDLAKLQGAWGQVRLEDDGVLLEGSFVTDASTRPNSITWIDAIGTGQGRPLLAR